MTAAAVAAAMTAVMMIARPITEECSDRTCLDLTNRSGGRSPGRHPHRRFSLMATTANAAERRDALVERLFMDAIGAFDLFSVYIGDVLGLYRTLADKGPLTSAELADARSEEHTSELQSRRELVCR